jgi:hypothetical protein
MDKGQSNIDIVFRNGLKDYEVLPPQEVWESIHPALKTKSRAILLMRTAALLAVLMTLSFFAYRWARELSSGINNSVISLNNNVDKGTPYLSASSDNRPGPKAKKPIALQTNSASRPETIASMDAAPENEKVTTPVIALHPQESKFLTYKTPAVNGLRSVAQNSTHNFNFILPEPDIQYLPGNSTTANSYRWSVAAMASPTYFSRFSSGNSDYSKLLASSEQPLVSYSGGVAFTYKISKRFSVQSGLYYSSLGQEVDGINSFGGFQKYGITKGDHNFEVLTTSGTIYAKNADVFLISTGQVDKVLTVYTNDVFDPKKASLQYLNNSIRQNFSYLELPVVLRYKVIDKAIDFNLIGGFSYNMLVNNSAFTIVDGARYSIGKTEGLNSVSFSSSIGMGMEYNFSTKLSLNLEPTFRYYLNPFTQTTGSITHPYSFGIFSGFSYKF